MDQVRSAKQFKVTGQQWHLAEKIETVFNLDQPIEFETQLING